jgi:hypothetical protein
MLTLENNRLTVRFPEIHPDAVCHIEFQRTLRIPDDNRSHHLPPGLGRFDLAHVDDHADKLPAAWQKRGGVFLPMHQAEAMWIKFDSRYPFAVKIASGKINAVTGKPWTPNLCGRLSRPTHLARKPADPWHDILNRGANSPEPYGGQFPKVWLGAPESNPRLGNHQDRRITDQNVGGEQDYVVLPKQEWVDGFCVGKGRVRQFVAMPMGEGYTVEEQITGEAIHGGLQIIIYPLKPEFYRRPLPTVLRSFSLGGAAFGTVSASASASGMSGSAFSMSMEKSAVADMGLAPGGLMEQTIHEDSFGLDKFDQTVSAKCFVHLLNSQQYETVTGKKPPHSAPTAADYTLHGLPWFQEAPAGVSALPGGKPLANLDSVANLGNKLGQAPLPENKPLPCAPKVVPVKSKPSNQVREGEF